MLLTEFEPDFFLPRYHEYIASLSGSKRSRAEIKLATRGDDALASRLDAGGGNILAFFELVGPKPMGRDENTPTWVQHLALKVASHEELMAALIDGADKAEGHLVAVLDTLNKEYMKEVEAKDTQDGAAFELLERYRKKVRAAVDAFQRSTTRAVDEALRTHVDTADPLVRLRLAMKVKAALHGLMLQQVGARHIHAV